MIETTNTIIIIILVIVIAYMILTIPARIARDKGYSFLKKSLMRRRENFWGRKQLFGNSEFTKSNGQIWILQ